MGSLKPARDNNTAAVTSSQVARTSPLFNVKLRRSRTPGGSKVLALYPIGIAAQIRPTARQAALTWRARPPPLQRLSISSLCSGLGPPRPTARRPRVTLVRPGPRPHRPSPAPALRHAVALPPLPGARTTIPTWAGAKTVTPRRPLLSTCLLSSSRPAGRIPEGPYAAPLPGVTSGLTPLRRLRLHASAICRSSHGRRSVEISLSLIRTAPTGAAIPQVRSAVPTPSPSVRGSRGANPRTMAQDSPNGKGD